MSWFQCIIHVSATVLMVFFVDFFFTHALLNLNFWCVCDSSEDDGSDAARRFNVADWVLSDRADGSTERHAWYFGSTARGDDDGRFAGASAAIGHLRYQTSLINGCYKTKSAVSCWSLSFYILFKKLWWFIWTISLWKIQLVNVDLSWSVMM